MKITLTQTGGIMGRSRTAEGEWPGTEDEFDNLVRKMKTGKDAASKDKYAYFIRGEREDRDIPISIQAIPAELDSFFESLFENLKVSD